MFRWGVMKMGCLGGRKSLGGFVVVATSSGVVDSGVVVVVSSSGVVSFSSSSTVLSHSSLVTENDEDTIVYGVAENRVTGAGVVVGLEGEIVDDAVVCAGVGPSVVVVVIVVDNGVVIGSAVVEVSVVVD